MFDTKTFSLEIEKLVSKKRMGYIDAIVLFCEKNGVEIETAAKLINSKIKKSLAAEASELNLLKEKTARLPI